MVSTHTPLARCDLRINQVIMVYLVSTHTPLARCDMGVTSTQKMITGFYSHTSCEV